MRYLLNIQFILKKILENLGTPHIVKNETVILENQEAKIFFNLLFREKPIIDNQSVPIILTKSSGVKINNKFFYKYWSSNR